MQPKLGEFTEEWILQEARRRLESENMVMIGVGATREGYSHARRDLVVV